MTDTDGMVLMRAAGMIRRHEGVRLRVYDDATGTELRPGYTLQGWPTIGIGRNLADPGISEAEAEILFGNDLKAALRVARSFAGPAWDRLDETRKAVLVDMAFNLGGRLAAFVRLRAAVQAGQWEQAAREMLQSRWARQVGRRATELADMMRTGNT